MTREYREIVGSCWLLVIGWQLAVNGLRLAVNGLRFTLRVRFAQLAQKHIVIGLRFRFAA